MASYVTVMIVAVTYVSVGLTEQARDALRGSTLALTSPAGRRLTLSDVLLALVHVGEQHVDEVLAVLGEPTS